MSQLDKFLYTLLAFTSGIKVSLLELLRASDTLRGKTVAADEVCRSDVLEQPLNDAFAVRASVVFPEQFRIPEEPAKRFRRARQILFLVYIEVSTNDMCQVLVFQHSLFRWSEFKFLFRYHCFFSFFTTGFIFFILSFTHCRWFQEKIKEGYGNHKQTFIRRKSV
jgi:hypothetical protein